MAAAAKDNRIKACCTMDIWFYPYKEDLNDIVLKDTPILHQRSDRYFRELSDKKALFDCRGVSEAYFTLVKEDNFKIQRFTVDNTVHVSQTDFMLLFPWTMSVIGACWCWPDSIKTISEKAIVGPWLQIEFLYNCQVINPYADIAAIRKSIREINNYIDYTDRFYGKDGIYIPHRIFSKDKKFSDDTNANSILPF